MTAPHRPTLADRYAELVMQTEATLRRSPDVLRGAETMLEQAQRAVERAHCTRARHQAAQRRDADSGHDPSPSTGGRHGAR